MKYMEIPSVIFMTRLFHLEAVTVPTGWNPDLCFGHKCVRAANILVSCSHNMNYDIMSNKLGSSGICEWTLLQVGKELQVIKSGYANGANYRWALCIEIEAPICHFGYLFFQKRINKSVLFYHHHLDSS